MITCGWVAVTSAGVSGSIRPLDWPEMPLRKRALEDALHDRAARAIHTSVIDELEASRLVIPPVSLQAMLTRPLHDAAAERDHGKLIFLLSGQAGALARSIMAGELMRRLVVETEDALSSLGR